MGSTEQQAQPTAPSTTARRLAWFVGIWAAGVLGLGALSYGLRWALGL